MRISTSLFSLLFYFQLSLFSQQTYQLDFQSYSITPPISFDTLGNGEIILAHQIFDSNILTESTALTYLTAQADTFWTRSFPDFRAEEIAKDSNGFVLAGNGLVKVDEQGILSWAFAYGKHIKALSLDGQNGYLIAGTNFLARIHVNGSVVWAKDLPLFIEKIIPTKNGNFAAATSTNSGQGYPGLLQFDLQGNILSAYEYIDGNQQGLGGAVDIVQGIDSIFYLAANITSPNFINEPSIIKTRSNGELIWLAKGGLVNGNDKLLYSLSLDTQQNLYVGGRGGTFMGGMNGRIPFVAKIDSSGITINAREILYAGSVKQLMISEDKLWAAGSYDIEFSGKEYLVLLDTSLGSCSYTHSSDLSGFVKSTSVSRNSLTINPGNLSLTPTGLNFSRNLAIPFSQTCFSCGDSADAAFSYAINGNSVSFEDSSSAALEWFWDFGDGTSSNQRNPSHTYTNTGSYEVCLSVGNECGTATICDSVSLWRTSQYLDEEKFSVLLSPNPAKDIVKIQIEAATFDTYQIILRNIEGKKLSTYSLGLEQEAELNISEYPSGIYVLEIQSSAGNKQLQKFIIDVAK
ncbi:MAG: PKD domain-containing protein [Bacteroidota bacterium]